LLAYGPGPIRPPPITAARTPEASADDEGRVNVDMEPEDALRLLLGEAHREPDEDESDDDADGY
jgi:hypothetical protein